VPAHNAVNAARLALQCSFECKHLVAEPKRKPVCACVQEPESQYMRFEMFDTDLVNVKAALKINFVKGVASTFNRKESMCKGDVFLRNTCVEHPGEAIERWFPLGTDDWSADEGPVRALQGSAASFRTAPGRLNGLHTAACRRVSSTSLQTLPYLYPWALVAGAASM
jgi:hypothetical protein